MRKSIALLAVGFLLAVGGCKNDGHHDDMNHSSSTEPKKMSMDACSHCAGVQTATADGKCPMCSGKVAK
ncbi:MAG: hypothetical protein H7Z14_03825 [Anaerolineae bacterium]|nr:hypothetical protein [Phycisphaerae bacterium]